jgi:hypothetical protein
VQEREVDTCQLVLQSFRIGGDYCGLSSSENGYEIAQCFAGTRASLDDEVFPGADRVRNMANHLGLSVPLFGTVEAGQYSLE